MGECGRCAIHISYVTLDTIIIILYTICISTCIAVLVFRGLLIVDEGRVILDNTTVSGLSNTSFELVLGYNIVIVNPNPLIPELQRVLNVRDRA